MNGIKGLLGVLIVMMALAGLGMATTTVSVTVNAGAIINAPDSTVSFNIGDNTVPMSNPVTMTSNGQVYLKATSATSWFSPSLGSPYMVGVVGAYGLYGTETLNPLEPFHYASDNKNLAETTIAGTFTIPILFQQHIDVSTPAGTTATDTIQFTAQGA